MRSSESPLLEEIAQEDADRAQRYGVLSLREQAAQDASNSFVEMWRSEPRFTAHAAFQGSALSFAVRIAPRRGSSMPARIGVAAMVVLATVLGAAACRRVHEAEWLARWAPLACVVGGAAWWLWLAPAIAGLALAAAGVWLSFRRPPVVHSLR
jgi:hypothetical protein